MQFNKYNMHSLKINSYFALTLYMCILDMPLGYMPLVVCYTNDM